MKNLDRVNTKKPSSRKQHGARPDLAGEHVISDIGQIIGLIAFLTVWILDSFIFHFSDFLSNYVPWWVLILIAIPIWTFAVYLAYNGMKMIFGGEPKEPSVISNGVFRITRHPIYLGSVLTYVGLIISTLSLFSLVILSLISLFYNYIASFEEKLLLEKFGNKYREYQRLVPKWGIRFVKESKQ